MKRVIACSRVSLFPPEHGGAKNLRSLMESLAAQGVECKVLVRVAPEARRFAGQSMDQLEKVNVGDFKWRHAGVIYEGVTEDLSQALKKELKRFDPDRVLLYDDSVEESLDLFETAANSGRMVFLAQTIHSLPFGPYAMRPSPRVTQYLKEAVHIVAPSFAVRDYVKKYLGRFSAVYRPNVFGQPPYRKLGNHSNPFITMINPCPWKGSSIFFKLAETRPDLKLAAVPTWGATPAIMETLQKLPNVTILKETPRIDEIFAQTRVLLAPSICQEAFGLVSPEALLRGVPVIASEIAGLRESTLGVAKLIPVRPLSFENPPTGDDPSKFVWEEPENSVAPWIEALDELLLDRSRYDEVSRVGMISAEEFVAEVRRQSVVEIISKQ